MNEGVNEMDGLLSLLVWIFAFLCGLCGYFPCIRGIRPRFWPSALRHYASPDQRQVGQAIGVLLFGRPADAAEDEDAEQGVVERPGVMTGDARDDAALMAFQGPKFGAGRVVFHGSAEDV